MWWLASLWRHPRRGGADLQTLLDRGFVALDLETTGLDPRSDEVVAAAAIPVVGGRLHAGYVTLVKPGRPIPATSTAIHGITDAMVAEAPPIAEVLDRLTDACDVLPIVGHRVDFDLAVLARDRLAHGRPPLTNMTFCTMRLAAALHRDWHDYGLDAVAERLGVVVEARHTAEGDAEAAARIFLVLLSQARARGIRSLFELTWLQGTAVLSR